MRPTPLNATIELGSPIGSPILPPSRGPISAALISYLLGRRASLPAVEHTGAAWADDDVQLALYCCYELHYRGFDGVSDSREWDPTILAFRAVLEHRFLADVVRAVGSLEGSTPSAVEDQLSALATTAGGRSLSSFMLRHATVDQLREFCIHRSGYQLKEADPHTWGIPRLSGGAKAAMVEIQADEYGNGVRSDMHAQLFADTMRCLDLDDSYGAYLDRLPAVTLATTNLVTMFGLHRRWRGALVGHLALFEMTSVTPMGRYADALERLGAPAAARRFYDVHVQIDDHHRVVALESMVRELLVAEPGLATDVLFGAMALTAVERRFADHLLDSWASRTTSLRVEPGQADAAACA